RPHPDGKPGLARPIRHVLALVGELCRHWIFARGIDARIDGVEDAADQDRSPDDLLSKLPCKRLDVVEGEIGPGAGAVEEEFDHCGFLLNCAIDPRSFRDAANTRGPQSITT